METVHVNFEKYLYGGEALGRLPDGRAVFVPFVLPGETAEVRIVFEKKGFSRGEAVRLLSKSGQRIEPRCKHFEICGGCHYQHLPYDEQLQVKKSVVIDQLERIGGIVNPPVGEVIPSPEPFYYRNTVQFHINQAGQPGFQGARGQGIIAIEECHLPYKAILDLWQQIDLERFPGLQRVQIRQGDDEDLMVLLESEDYENLPTLEIDAPVSVIHLSPAGKLVMAGDDHLIMPVKDRLFHVSADSFFQVNLPQAENLVDQVLNFLPDAGGTLLELYSGAGLFTAFLAERFQEVVAVEVDESACDDFAINLDRYDHISLYIGTAEDVLPGLNLKADAVLVDPPRSGLDRKALDALVQMAAPQLVYVSCDPATLARDVKRLVAGGYRLESVVPFDMFPQTYHIETVGLLKKQ